MSTKSFTLRMPIELYGQVAARKQKSVTGFVLEAVQEKLAREREEEIRRGFESLGEDFDWDEYNLWAGLQRKAMKHVDD
jgi:hypothetical protein